MKHLPSTLSLVLALAQAPAAAGTAAAQSPRDTFRLREIVVTATRTPQPRTAIPAHVTVLDGAQLREHGISDVAEALRDAGVGSISQGGAPGAAASLFLRGGESDYVQVLVDGVQVNEPGGAFDWAHLSTADIERIEIVRGPVSVLYGSDAVTGVVQIFTRSGGGPARIDAQLGAVAGERIGPGADGAFTTWNGSARAGGGGLLGGRQLGWSVSAAREISGGVYAFNNDYRNTTLSARGSYAPAAGTSLVLSARTGAHRYHYPTDGAGAVVDHNRYTDGASRALSLALEQRVGRALRAALTLGSYRNETGGNDPADQPEQGWSRSGARVRRDVAELRLDAEIGPTLVWSVGGELERQLGRTWFDSDGPFGPYRDASRNQRRGRAGYTQLLADLGRVSLTGGARLDRSDQFGAFATARAGAVFRIARAFSMHGAFGSGFKEPTFFETYATGFARGNPDLAPEQTRTGEIGAAWSPGSLRLRATVFDQRFRNLIQYTATPPQPDAPSYFNVGRARARGVEAEASLALSRLAVRAAHTYLDTRVLDEGFGTDPQFRSGLRLLRRPAQQSSLAIEWRAHARLLASLRARRSGERDDLDFSDPAQWQGVRVTLPAYTVADADVSWALPVAPGDAALLLGVRNLGNERYEEIRGFAQPGRVFSVGLRWGRELSQP